MNGNLCAEAKPVRRWIEAGEDRSIASLQRAVDDPGGQLKQFLSGNRDTLPLHLKALVALETGLPLDPMLDDEQRELARVLMRCLARDASR